VPSGIRQEFELKACHQDCSDCYLDKDFKNSSENNDLSFFLARSNSGNDNGIDEVERLTRELIEAKKQEKSQAEIKQLESNLQKLNIQQQKKETKPTKNNDLLISGAIIFSAFALVLGLILILIGRNNKRKKEIC
jgi:hypothetical protein